jgi:glycyl-tRNA synthetase
VSPTRSPSLLLCHHHPELDEVAAKVAASLTAAGLSNIIDTTGTTIGKRYSRTDELGVPFAITVDYQFQTDDTVTLRERDSMEQVRVPIPEIASVIRALVDGATCWADVKGKFPAQAAPATVEEDA